VTESAGAGISPHALVVYLSWTPGTESAAATGEAEAAACPAPARPAEPAEQAKHTIMRILCMATDDIIHSPGGHVTGFGGGRSATSRRRQL
jgi:hypothetical protein